VSGQADRRAALSISRRGKSGAVTSPASARATPPAAAMSETVSASASSSLSLARTRAPSVASNSAVARPMPRPAPVTTAVFLSKRPSKRPSKRVGMALLRESNSRGLTDGVKKAESARVPRACGLGRRLRGASMVGEHGQQRAAFELLRIDRAHRERGQRANEVVNAALITEHGPKLNAA